MQKRVNKKKASMKKVKSGNNSLSMQQTSLKKQSISKEKLPTVASKQTIKTVVTVDVYNKMKYLCEKISAVEWSGVLFYTVEGSIKDPKNMVITMQNILPLDKGTSGYTEYTLDERLTDFLMDNPSHLGYKIGHIHSHNTMSVFFSGTDMEELTENSESHNYYFSFIVNNKMEMTAKVGQMAKSQSKSITNLLDDNGETYSVESLEETKTVVVYDCVIHNTYVSVEDEVFKKNVEEIMKPKPSPVSQGFGMGFRQGTPTPKQPSLFSDIEVEDVDYGPGFTWSPPEDDTNVLVDPELLCTRLLANKRVGAMPEYVTLQSMLKEKDKSSKLRQKAVEYFFTNLDVYLRDITKTPVEEQDLGTYIEDLVFIRDVLENYDGFKIVDQLVMNLEDIIEKLYKGIK